MKNRLVILVACIVCVAQQSFAQCSDAGVCSIGHKPEGQAQRPSVAYQLGKSSKTDDLRFHSLIISLDFKIFENSNLSVSIPYSGQSGPLGTTSGIGDMTVLWTQRILDGEASKFGVQFGGKVALANVNAGNLPQAYQSGLGTTDALVGFTYEPQEWNFAVAYQLSRGRSVNRINRLMRCDDVLLRAGYTHTFVNGTIGAEVLTIKRLAQSSVLTSLPGQPETFDHLSNSDQAQINIIGRGSYPLSKVIEVQGMVAIPMLKRDVNVDGLTRSLSLSAGLSFAF